MGYLLSVLPSLSFPGGLYRDARALRTLQDNIGAPKLCQPTHYARFLLPFPTALACPKALSSLEGPTSAVTRPCFTAQCGTLAVYQTWQSARAVYVPLFFQEIHDIAAYFFLRLLTPSRRPRLTLLLTRLCSRFSRTRRLSFLGGSYMDPQAIGECGRRGT